DWSSDVCSSDLRRPRRRDSLDRGDEDVDGLEVLGDGEVLVWRVVEAAVAWAVGDPGAVPEGAEDVHVAGAGLEARAGGAASGADGAGEGADEHVVAVGGDGALGARTLDGGADLGG